MIFDPTLSLGNILTIVVIGIGGLAFLWSMKGDTQVLVERLRNYEDIVRGIHGRLDKMEGAMDGIALALTKIAVQENRLDSQDQRMQEFARRFNDFENVIRALATNGGNGGPIPRSRKK